MSKQQRPYRLLLERKKHRVARATRRLVDCLMEVANSLRDISCEQVGVVRCVELVTSLLLPGLRKSPPVLRLFQDRIKPLKMKNPRRLVGGLSMRLIAFRHSISAAGRCQSLESGLGPPPQCRWASRARKLFGAVWPDVEPTDCSLVMISFRHNEGFEHFSRRRTFNWRLS
jgi:hypothetical protein